MKRFEEALGVHIQCRQPFIGLAVLIDQDLCYPCLLRDYSYIDGNLVGFRFIKNIDFLGDRNSWNSTIFSVFTQLIVKLHLPNCLIILFSFDLVSRCPC